MSKRSSLKNPNPTKRHFEESLAENVSPDPIACEVTGNVAIESPPASAAVVAVVTPTPESPKASVPSLSLVVYDLPATIVLLF